MLYKGVLTRVLPFFLTFAAGLFIASFFINISTPSFAFPRKSYKYREMQRLRDENRDLRKTNSELRRQLEEARQNSLMTVRNHFDVPSFEVDAPLPPPPPPVRRQHRVAGER